MNKLDKPDITNLELRIREYERSDGTIYVKGMGFTPVMLYDDNTSWLVAEINNGFPHDFPDDIDVEYAERIVACVNAFKGLPTQEILKYRDYFNTRKRIWKTAKGEIIPIPDLTDDHLINIFKYYTSANLLPPIPVLLELEMRKLLKQISDEIKPRGQYSTPQEHKTSYDNKDNINE